MISLNIENILILSILVGAIILFVSEKLRVDVVAMIVLATLVLTGLVNLEQAFSGFANPAVITVWAVFIVSGGITRSGVADSIARLIVRFAGQNSARRRRPLFYQGGRNRPGQDRRQDDCGLQ